MQREAKVTKGFPFAFDGINLIHLGLGSKFPAEGYKVPDATFDGLVAAGYIEETASTKVPGEEQLNRDIIDSFDRRLGAASDEELKSIIARSGTPYSGNMVHASLVFAAKRQLLAEMDGAIPVVGINPHAGVTEQPLSAPGAPTPPSAAAAVQQQQAEKGAAEKAAGENKATNQFGEPLGAGASTGETKLEELTVAQLKEHADAGKIDLGGATKKEDIITAIRAAEKA